MVSGTDKSGWTFTSQEGTDIARWSRRLKLAEQRAGLGLWEIDIPGRQIWWSNQIYILLGVDPSSSAIPDLESGLEYVHPEDRPRLRAIFEQTRPGTGPMHEVFRTNPQRGAIRMLAAIFELDMDMRGQALQVFGTLQDVTEQRHEEELLRYQSVLLENVNDAVVAADASFRLVFWNAAAETMYGWRAEEVLGRNGLEVLQTQWQDVDSKTMRHAITEKGNWHGEATQVRKDGSRFHVDVSSLVIRDENGQPMGYVSVNCDITERKQVEQALKESEWRNRIVSQLTTDYIFIVDVEPDGLLKLRWVSENMQRVTGRTVEDAATSDLWSNILHPDDTQHFFEWAQKILSSRNSGEFECRAFHKQGSERWIHIFAQPQLNENDQVTMVVGAIKDVTERKLMERVLQESENRFRAILQHVPTVAVQGYAMDTTTQYWNTASEKLYGYEAREAIGRSLLDLIIPPEMREGVSQAIQQMAETGQPAPASELTLMRKDGTRVTVYSSHAIVSVEGHPPELFCLDVDLTDRKQAEEKLRYLGTHDALTGLYNRSFFEEEMMRLEGGRTFPISIVMADVDHLKKTNDQQGHASGDELLKRAAQTLTAAFRTEDVIARIGGDEFAVLLPSTDAAAAEVSLQRVQQTIAEDNAIHPEVPLQLSLGFSTAEPFTSLSDTFKQADANMYRDKRRHNA